MIYDVVGIAGVVCILLAYFLLQSNAVKGHDWPYLILNITGSLLVIVSLTDTWNLPSFLIQVSWIVISIYGIVKRLKATEKETP